MQGGTWVNSSESFNVSGVTLTCPSITVKYLGKESGCCGSPYYHAFTSRAWFLGKTQSFAEPKALPPNIFLICGDRAWQGIPRNPVGGPCYLGKLTMLAPNHTEILKILVNGTSRSATRRRRSISHLDSTCSDEVQLWSATARIFASILAPGVAAAQALREIERLACWSIKQANLTTSLLSDLLTDVTSIRHAVLQNRAAIDFLLLAHGHGCEDVGGMCCFNLSDHSESIHKKFQLMREHVNKIGVEKDPIGDWLRGLFGGIGEWGVHLLKGLLLGLVVLLLLVICVPCLLQMMLGRMRKMINRTLDYRDEYEKMLKA
ncbi:syncytin-A-like [Cyrtonyx montezumae]|uniref:syncytin-A-like n=1 Tax=Cyrtonyx montezumae TaxID=9017 RepID=UPI0032DBBA0E